MSTLTEISRALFSGAAPTAAPASSGSALDAAPWMAPRFEGEALGEGVFFVSSFANVAAFSTAEGLVLVDTGSFLLAEPTRVLLRRLTEQRAHTAIFTHGHVDHCFGVERYEAEAGGGPVRVVGHEAIARRFARYRLTHGYNARINGRQFQVAAQFPSEFREPELTYRDALSLDVGGRRFELRHALGETDDHTYVWVPDARALCTGDLFIWASPNCGNPQKAQRFPREWAEALRAMAALEPEVLLPGHGLPIVGARAIALALGETAELLESLVSQVLDLMNQGARLDEVLARVRPPAHLLERPYLAPVYDEPEFVVRNLWRLYGGWWDGNPASLKPAREEALARELASLAGGARALAERALGLADAGELALACHLAELAATAAPGDARAHEARASVYEARAERERSLMAKGVFTAAASESRELEAEARRPV
jgi:glyoxylase-like metal-dependent hydrolase (beta-lactamase superfamily II)